MKIPLKRWPKLMMAQVYTRNSLTHRLISRLPRKYLDRPIFILGVPRSGTSIFCTLFGANRNLAHWSEAQAAWDPKWRDPIKCHRWEADYATPKRVRRIENNFAYFTKVKKCDRFVNKCPRNALRVPFLMKAWPEAFIMHIRRDPRAVVNSLITEVQRDDRRHGKPLGNFARPEGWEEMAKVGTEVEQFCQMVVKIHRTMVDDLARCTKPHNLFEFQYEEFGKDCQGMLRQAFAFCDVKVDERAMEMQVPEFLENRNYKWARTRTSDEIEIMDHYLTPILLELGYEDDESWVKNLNLDDK